MTTESNQEREYILGTGGDELVRLGFQHRVWGAQAHALWDRAGIGLGRRVLDAGCGPGYATMDLAYLVGSAGRVIAVDESARFISHLRERIEANAIDNVETHVQDVQSLDLPESCVDAAYCRWVLCFVRDPEAVVAGVSRALAPGGVFAVQDYFNYRALALAPRSASLERVVDAVVRSWVDHGGDPDLAGRLPGIMRRHGLEIREVTPNVRVARPGSQLWGWPTTFFRNFLPVLERDGYLSTDERIEFEHEWVARSKDADTFFCTPPVFDLIAVRR